MKRETGNRTLDALRAFVRYETHGGYAWAAVLDDSGLICERCTKANYREIYRATQAHDYRSGWAVAGLLNSGDSDETEYCVQCNKLLWETP